jgi:hypothetical protein
MNDELLCWRCSAALTELPLPLSRLAECPACRTELHVCRMCLYYDPSVARSCREPIAEDVHDKQRANYCGYYTPRPNAYAPGNERSANAERAALDALFGPAPAAPADSGADTGPAGGEPARDGLDALFGPRGDDGKPR